ncbi:MAG: inorganic phosphate transporter [Thermodesulfobacteriota bacterium]
MDSALLVAIAIIAVALVFDFINGFHDAANSIATVVSTQVLTPRTAVLWAAFFNFIAAFGFETHVAKTIGKDVIDIQALSTAAALSIVTAGLIGAIVWNLITWAFGLPSSSSHALVGGLVGAAMAEASSFELVHWRGIEVISIFIVVAPAMGLGLGALLMVALAWIFRRWPPLRIDRWFRIGQLFSAGFYSLGHGLNDAQKTMGVIFMVLAATNYLSEEAVRVGHVPFWVVLICHAAMGLGTAMGGWRIVKTMGMRITKLKPVGGFAAETAGGITLALNSWMGIPVSTTHVITGAIAGVGFTRGTRAVRWGIAGTIVWAWVLTIPMSGLVAALTWYVIRLFL